MLAARDLRSWLSAWLQGVVPEGVAVFPAMARDGFASLPAVGLGALEVPEFGVTACLDVYTLPVVVAWPRPGISEEDEQAGHETLWLGVLGALQDLQAEEDTLGGHVAEWHLGSAEYGTLEVRGAAYPAYVITCQLTA